MRFELPTSCHAAKKIPSALLGKTETMAANTMVAKPRLLIWDFFR